MLFAAIWIGVAGLIVGAILGRAHERDIWQRRLLEERGIAKPDAKPAAALAASEESVNGQNVAQALDAMAIEIERIGESQRFLTKLLADKPRPDRG